MDSSSSVRETNGAAQPTKQDKQRRRPAHRGPLVRWNDIIDHQLLLTITHVCAVQGIKLPWPVIGNHMNATVGGNFTEGAIVQHLAKLRTRLQPTELEDTIPVPQDGLISGPTTTYIGGRRMKSPPQVAARLLDPQMGSIYAKPGAKPKIKAKSKKRAASDDDDEDDEPELYDSDDDYKLKEPLTKRVKGDLETLIKKKDGGDEGTPKKRTAASKTSIAPDNNRGNVAEGPAFNTRRVRRMAQYENAEHEEEVETNHQEDMVAPLGEHGTEFRGHFEDDNPVSPKTQAPMLPINQMVPPMANVFNNYQVPANNFSFSTSEIAPAYGYNNRSFTLPILPSYSGFNMPLASQETSFASSRTGSAMSTMGFPGALAQNGMMAPNFGGNLTFPFNMYGDVFNNPFGNLSRNPFDNMATGVGPPNLPNTAYNASPPMPWNNTAITEQNISQAANPAGSYLTADLDPEEFGSWDTELFANVGDSTLSKMEGDEWLD